MTSDSPSDRERASGTERAEAFVLPPSIRIRGSITSDRSLRVEGEIEGSVTVVVGDLHVAGGARLKADLCASRVSVAGEVEGNVAAREVELHGTARLFGDVAASSFAIRDGAVFQGCVGRTGDAAADATATDAPASTPTRAPAGSGCAA